MLFENTTFERGLHRQKLQPALASGPVGRPPPVSVGESALRAPNERDQLVHERLAQRRHRV
jgi:hypothetical protein